MTFLLLSMRMEFNEILSVAGWITPNHPPACSVTISGFLREMALSHGKSLLEKLNNNIRVCDKAILLASAVYL